MKGITNLTGINRSSIPQITKVCDLILLILILLAVVLYFRAEANAALAPGIDILSKTKDASLPLTGEEEVSDNAFIISAFDVTSITSTYFRSPEEPKKDLGEKPAGLISINLPTSFGFAIAIVGSDLPSK